ncbi:MAG: GHMP kinase [Acidimicrobiales bacterium]
MISQVTVQAPVRVLDAGGWTDTWFSRTGRVCHLCTGPGAQVLARLRPRPRGAGGAFRVHLRVPAYGDDYSFDPRRGPGRHPLLEAALERWAPPGCSLEVSVEAAVPAGSSLGTSAAVVVALLGALKALGEEPLAPADLARAAHEVETVDLGRQSGVQDQVAAAYGGANVVDVDPYPEFEVRSLKLLPETAEELARRVVTIYLALGHDSSAVHEAVINHLEGHDDDAARLLAPLREAATRAAAALVAGDIVSYGEAMVANTEAQVALHPSLVNPLARKVIRVAARSGALGWKVNGAGGAGGSLTLVAGDDPERLLNALAPISGVTVLDLRPVENGAHVVDQA